MAVFAATVASGTIYIPLTVITVVLKVIRYVVTCTAIWLERLRFSSKRQVSTISTQCLHAEEIARPTRRFKGHEIIGYFSCFSSMWVVSVFSLDNSVRTAMANGALSRNLTM